MSILPFKPRESKSRRCHGCGINLRAAEHPREICLRCFKESEAIHALEHASRLWKQVIDERQR